MRRSVALLALAILATIPTASHAQAKADDRWHLLKQFDNGPTVLLDSRTVTSKSSSRVVVWLSFVYAEPQTSELATNYTYVLYHQIEDCKTRQVALLEGIAYTSDGSVAKDVPMPAGIEYFTDVPPSSKGEAVLDAICNPEKP
jgi:hypothetical protein